MDEIYSNDFIDTYHLQRVLKYSDGSAEAEIIGLGSSEEAALEAAQADSEKWWNGEVEYRILKKPATVEVVKTITAEEVKKMQEKESS